MRMEINEPGSDNHALGVEFLGTFSGDLADLDDASAGDSDIGVTWLCARAVEDGAAADDEIETVVHSGFSVAGDIERLRASDNAVNAMLVRWRLLGCPAHRYRSLARC